MGFLDDKIGDVNKGLDALTGGNAAGGGAAEKVRYELDIPLDGDDQSSGTPVGKDASGGKANAVDTGIPVEFIHFSQVHHDSGHVFPHNKISPPDLPEAPEGHAIMFRDALQREAIMMHGFISSSLVVVKEATASQGGLQDVANMAGSLLGGGGGAKPPDPSKLDGFLDDLKSAADVVKPISITYPNTHDTGKKFHETRNKYIEFCDSLNAYYLKPPQENPAESMAKGVIANVPGIGKWINIIMRYAFKLQDVYLAVFLQIREDHERNIELAAHQLTIDAIKGKYAQYNLVYPVWFKKPESQTPVAPTGGGSNPFKPITDAVKSVTDEADSIKKDIYGFFGKNGEPEETPGSSQLGEIFGKMRGAAKDTSDAKQPPTTSESICSALDATLSDVGGLPKVMRSIVAKVNDANLGLLEEVYRRLMAVGMTDEIDAALLLEAGRRHLSGLVVDTAMDFAKGFMSGIPTGIHAQGMNLSAEDLLKKQIYEHLSKYTEPILKIAIGDLTGQMEAARKKAQAEKAQTMEVLLGRLPWLTALMFRNTFFPIWNLVVEEVFGKAAAPLKEALKAVNEPINKAKDTVDDIAEKKRKAEAVKKVADEQGLQAGTSGRNTDAYDHAMNDETPEGKAREEERARQKEAEEKKGELDEFYKKNDKEEKFPVTGREADGEGLPVTEEIASVVADPSPADSAASPPAGSPVPALPAAVPSF